MFKNFQEFNNYKKNKNHQSGPDLHNLNYITKFETYSGIYELQYLEKEFKYLNIGNDDMGILKFFWGGEPEFLSMHLWTLACQQDGFCLDIGAHTGRYTVIGSLFGKNKIVSFEPYFLNYSRMLSNLRLNEFSTNNCFMAGVSSRSDKGILNIKGNNFFHTSAGKVDKNTSSGLQIQLIKIDDIKFKHRVVALKIDTEGHESEVLKGATSTIEKYGPTLIIEKNTETFNECINILNKYDYEIFFVNDSLKKITTIEKEVHGCNNFICISKKNYDYYMEFINTNSYI